MNLCKVYETIREIPSVTKHSLLSSAQEQHWKLQNGLVDCVKKLKQ